MRESNWGNHFPKYIGVIFPIVSNHCLVLPERQIVCHPFEHIGMNIAKIVGTKLSYIAFLNQGAGCFYWKVGERERVR